MHLARKNTQKSNLFAACRQTHSSNDAINFSFGGKHISGRKH
jgi:hypothetical protein